MPPKRRVEGMAESPRVSKRKELTKSENIVRQPPIPVPKRSSRAKVEQTVVANSGSTKAETKIEETKVDLEAVEHKQVATPRKRRKLEETARPVVKQEITQEPILPTVKDSKKRKAGPAKTKEENSDSEANAQPKKKVLKRKTKEEKEAEAMPLAARTTGLRMFIGAHVSIAKGVQNAVTNSVHIGANSFALFLKSQRKWDNPPLQDENKKLWHSACKEHSYDANNHVLPHGSYLVNLAQSEAEKAKQAYDAFVDDLKRCEALGIRYYNFHPGNTGQHPRAEAIGRIANSLNRAIKETKTVKPVLETMAGGSNVIGSTFEDLRDIIAQIEDKSRIGVCIDTCHIFAAGYDLRTPETFKTTMDQFQSIVDMKYLSAFHLNDSKAPFGSHRDLHQNIGLGFLGLRAFHSVMNDVRFEGLPMVLETPIDSKDEAGKALEDKGIWAKEIKLLESLIGMDPEGVQFKALEKQLADKGAAERGKHADQQKRKKEKEAKSEATKLKRTKKKRSASTESDQSD